MFSVTSSCAQHLYALKILRPHGMFDEALQQIFRAVVISSMLSVERMAGIHISRWQHLEAFLRRSMRSCLCSLEQEDLMNLLKQQTTLLWKLPLSRRITAVTTVIPHLSLLSIKREKLAAVCGSALEFIMRPGDVTTTEGRRVVLLCAANGRLQPTHISWLKDGTLLNTLWVQLMTFIDSFFLCSS